MKDSSTPYIISVLSSIASAITTKTAIAPLERLKLLKQSQLYYKRNVYQSMSQSFRHIYQQENIEGFFRGNFSNILRIVPIYMLKFPLNEHFQKKFRRVNQQGPLSFHQLLAAGICSGTLQISLTYPLDTLRTRMSLDKQMITNYTNISNCIQNVIRQEGVRAFYKGFPVCGSTYPIYVGLQFSIYDSLKEDYPSLVSGAIAGIIAQTLMYPGDTIKRQMQLNGIPGVAKQYKSIPHCIKVMYQQHGIRGYYPALHINIIKAIPGAGIQFWVYDHCKDYLSKHI